MYLVAHNTATNAKHIMKRNTTDYTIVRSFLQRFYERVCSPMETCNFVQEAMIVSVYTSRDANGVGRSGSSHHQWMVARVRNRVVPVNVSAMNAEFKREKINVRIKKTEYGDELRVNFVGGKEATAYYTDDLTDAYETARAMYLESYRKQAVIKEVPYDARVTFPDGEELIGTFEVYEDDRRVIYFHGEDPYEYELGVDGNWYEINDSQTPLKIERI